MDECDNRLADLWDLFYRKDVGIDRMHACMPVLICIYIYIHT